MILNHLYVTLMPESIDLLNAITKASPIYFDWAAIRGTIIVTPDDVKPVDGGIYTARCGTLTILYDQTIGASSLYLPLDSTSMHDSYDELVEQGIRPAFEDDYHPHLTVIPGIQALPRHIKSFINSVSTMLATGPEVLILGNETVVAEEFNDIPDIYYNQEARANGW